MDLLGNDPSYYRVQGGVDALIISPYWLWYLVTLQASSVISRLPTLAGSTTVSQIGALSRTCTLYCCLQGSCLTMLA